MIKRACAIFVILALILTAFSGCADESDSNGHVFQYSSRSNGGTIAGYGDWIYYSAYSSGGVLPGEYLNKIRTDGTGWDRMNWTSFASINDINIFSDRIYYIDGSDMSLQKQKIGDSESTQLFFDMRIDQMQIVDDWIYYTDGDKSNRIYKIHEDGSGRKRLTRDWVNYFCVDGNHIYYSRGLSGGLYSITTKGRGKTKLADTYTTRIQVVDDWIYYRATEKNSQGFWKMRTDGTEKTKLVDSWVSAFCVADDYVYYSILGEPSKYQVYKVRNDASENALIISENENINDLYYYNDCIYYLADSYIHVIDKDGNVKVYDNGLGS